MRPISMTALALLPALSAACATDQQGPRPLTVKALERISVKCGVSDARLASDQHLSILLDGETPDRPRQVDCLFEQVRARGYWVDQIVTENANGTDQ